MLSQVFAAPSHAQSVLPEDQPKTVRGVVVDSVTHAPIARALVSSNDDRFAALTDGSGGFEFPLPKSEPPDPANGGGVIHTFIGSGRQFRFQGDQLQFAARKPGFFGDSTQSVPNSGGEITISLVPEALIKGRITLSTGDAAAGVRIQLYSRDVIDGLWRWQPRQVVQANSAGEFRFAELEAGLYKLVTHELMDNDPLTIAPGGQMYGFPPVYYPGAPDLASAATIDLSAGQTVEANLALVRQPYYPVKIPVANNEVGGGLNISVEGQRGPGYSLGYNANDGEIRGLLPNGNYLVEGTAYGAKSATGKVNLSVSGGPAEGPAMTIALASSITLNVSVQFNDNQQAPYTIWNSGSHSYTFHGPRAYLGNARLESADDFERQRGGSGIRPPTGPDDDSLVIENVSPGQYWLQMYPSRGYVASATMGGKDVLHEPLVIGAGGASASIDVKLRDDFAEIDGAVTNLAQASLNESGPTVTAAWICFLPLPDSSGQFQQIEVSGGDGKFNHPMIVPGSYRILAFAQPPKALPYREPGGMKAYESKGQVITLTPGQKATIQLQMLPGTD